MTDCENTSLNCWYGTCNPFKCECRLTTVIVPVKYDSTKINTFCYHEVNIQKTLVI